MNFIYTFEELQHLKKFLIPKRAQERVNSVLMSKLEEISKRIKSKKVVLGKCEKFGNFILGLDIPNSSGDLYYCDKNKGSAEYFMSFLSNEDPYLEKTIKVNLHKRSGKYDDYVPRVYIDGLSLVEIGYEPGDKLLVRMNKSTGIIEIIPKERSK